MQKQKRERKMNKKLARLVSLLCSLGLNTLFASSAFGHLGVKLEDMQRTDFFTWFHLERVSTEADAQQRTVVAFKPEGEKFRALVTVNVTLAPDDYILAIELVLTRAFVDHPADGIFARDIAKSFLRTIVPQEDRGAISDLANEIEYQYPEDLEIFVLTAKRPEIPLPAVPTPGYQTFLGQQQAYTQSLSHCTLGLENFQSEGTESLRILVQGRS